MMLSKSGSISQGVHRSSVTGFSPFKWVATILFFAAISVGLYFISAILCGVAAFIGLIVLISMAHGSHIAAQWKPVEKLINQNYKNIPSPMSKEEFDQGMEENQGNKLKEEIKIELEERRLRWNLLNEKHDVHGNQSSELKM